LVVLYSIAYAGYGFAATIEWMYAARLLQGLGAALLLLTVDAITTDIAPQNERASAMGQNLRRSPHRKQSHNPSVQHSFDC
jgi:MFS family permease